MKCVRSSMDRASDSGSECWGFESLRAYQKRWVVILPPISFVLTVASDANQASPNGSPSWEGTRSGAAYHRHAALRFGFGRTRGKSCNHNGYRTFLPLFSGFSLLFSLIDRLMDRNPIVPGIDSSCQLPPGASAPSHVHKVSRHTMPGVPAFLALTD